MKRSIRLLLLILLMGSLHACTYVQHCPTYESHYRSYKGKHPLSKKSSLSHHHRSLAKSR